MADQQLLRDPNIPLTDETLAAALGDRQKTFSKFTERLKSSDVVIEWRYYNDGKAWLGKGQYKWTTPRGANKETTCFWFSVWDGFFRVTVFVKESVRAEAQNLPVSKAVKKEIAEAKQIGKLKFFPIIFVVRSDEILDDICTLVDFKKRIG